MLADRAFRGLVAGEPVDHVARLAAQALADGDLLDVEGPDGPAFQIALGVLVWSGRFRDAEPAIDEALHRAEASGSVGATATVLYRRSMMRLFEGRLLDAISDGTKALAARDHGWHLFADSATAGVALALLEHGELEAAARFAATDGAGDTPMYAWLLEARGRVAAARGDHESAIADLRACGSLLDELGVANPATSGWRGGLAEVLHRAGREREASQLASEEVALAERFGAPVPLAAALRCLARVERAKNATSTLGRAVALIDDSGAKLVAAKVRSDFGVALLRAGQRADGVAELQTALQLALECAAEPLATRVRAELRHVGSKPARASAAAGVVGAGGAGARAVRAGVDSLTPSERRVAELAIQGLSNREIAGELFVSVKAVEYHLGNAYAKLGISGRRELAPALH